jgi:hypothetical protein
MDGYVMQHNATTHTESFSISGLEVVFGERLWPPGSSDLNPRDYMWETLKDNIRKEIVNIFREDLRHVSRNIFRRPAKKMEVSNS